jgi:diguanylate cyclase
MTEQPTLAPKSAARDLERLAEVIIETIKELSTARQMLTPATLSKALTPHREVIHRLTRSTKQETTPLAGTREETELQAQRLDQRLKLSLDHEQELERQMAGLEEQLGQSMAFYRKAMLTLIVLANHTQVKDVSDQLDTLRSLIASEAQLHELEQCLDDLKSMIFKERAEKGTNLEDSSGKGLSFWGSWRKRMDLGRSKSEVDPYGAGLSMMQSSLAAILSQFQTDPGHPYRQQFEELQQRIRKCDSVNSLAPIGEELATLIRNYLGTTAEERQQIASFVTEFRKSFLEMESHVLASLSDTQDGYQADVEFNHTLSGQMDDIKESFSISKSIEEIRSLVYSKLQGIKSALEEKRKQDGVRLEQSNRKMSELQQHLQSMKTEINQIQERTKSLEEEVLLDSLTNTHNRRAYEMRIDEELQRFKRYNQIFSLILFDVDHFKRVNDQYGHRAGDKCLREIVNRIRPSVRKVDFLARYGGEEFIVILPGTTGENAGKAAEKLRQIIERTSFLFQGHKITVTISSGVTQADSSDEDPQTIFARVDAAMYEAKREGRNRVVVR